MADAATTADAVRTDAAPADHSFLWRRLHSLSGVLPLGALLCYHMFENMSALAQPGSVRRDGQPRERDCSPRPFFYALELVTIVLPLAYHALYGVWVRGDRPPQQRPLRLPEQLGLRSPSASPASSRS